MSKSRIPESLPVAFVGFVEPPGLKSLSSCGFDIVIHPISDDQRLFRPNPPPLQSECQDPKDMGIGFAETIFE